MACLDIAFERFALGSSAPIQITLMCSTENGQSVLIALDGANVPELSELRDADEA